MLLSLSGIPPLTGFIPKWLTIYSISLDTPITLILLILGAIINIYFYINILFNSLLSINFHTTVLNQTPSSPKLTTIIATMSLFILPVFAI
jgi:NADH-ubiquinone oxidoreductase chain 2